MATPDTIASIPRPERVREDLVELYKAVRLARSLLRLAERVHAPADTSTPTTRKEVSGAR